MISPEILELIKDIAIYDFKLIKKIATLPKINHDNFYIEEWKVEFENLNIGYEDEFITTNYHFIDFLYDKTEDNRSYIRYTEDRNIIRWNIICLDAGYHIAIDTKCLSELIDVCKDKDFEELLNFI